MLWPQNDTSPFALSPLTRASHMDLLNNQLCALLIKVTVKHGKVKEILFQPLMTLKAPTACLSLQPCFIPFSFSFMFQPQQTFGCSSLTPSSFLHEDLCRFSFSLQCFQSQFVLATPSGHPVLSSMSPSQLRHLPHLTITFCPLAFLSSSEPHFLFPHLFKISIMCFVEHFSVFYRALLFFSHFFPKIILCIYFLSCGFLSLPCTFHNRSFLSVLEIQPLSCQSLRVVVGSG